MPTILVVDDDPKFLCAVERMLTTAGYHVLRASDGKEAEEILERKHNEIDLAIMDLALPGINGFEIIGDMSRRPNSVKIIATTSVYKDDLLTMAGTLGAHAAIRKPPEGKPLPERDWLRVVDRLIGNRAPEQRMSAAGASGAGSNDSEPSNGTETSY
jgi:putative two-component system response regulator